MNYNDIKLRAAEIHASVNQFYDDDKPYSFHLNMVADNVMRYADSVLACEEDRMPLVFGAYFHDSIEDARLTYNDVRKIAKEYMTDEQATTAAEIVYALTNDKGRTRQERAGEKYYQGIRSTPYAPFVKLCDRMANMTYSCRGENDSNSHMREVYHRELPHFIESIRSERSECQYALPQQLIDDITKL